MDLISEILDQSTTSKTVILTAAGTLLVSLAVQYFTHWLSLNREIKIKEIENNKISRYTELKFICILDNFISDCWEVSSDEGAPGLDGVYSIQSLTPNLNLPENENFRFLDKDIAFSILSLPNRIRRANEYIDDAFENSDAPDFVEAFTERRKQYAKIGTLAAQIRNTIRAKHKIEEFDSDTSEKISYFAKTLDEIKKNEIARTIRNAEMHAKLIEKHKSPK